MSEVALIAPDDPRWSRMLDQAPHDFHHLPAFVELEAERGHGAARGLWVEESGSAVLLPLIVRALPDALGVDGQDAISPYGYPSPLFSDASQASRESLVRRLPEALSASGLVSAFVRLHPLLDAPLEAMSRAGELIEHGPTVWIDLNDSLEAMWSQTRSSDRNRMNKLRRLGFRAYVDEDWERIDAFVDLYSDTMEFLGASAGYFYDRDYFERLREALDQRLHLCVVECPEGEVVSAGVFSEIGGLVQFHLSGTRTDHRRTSPSRLMIDHMRGFAKARGATRFHLGGGVGAAEDRLYEFKRGFSPYRAVFCSWRLVGDSDAYAAADAEAVRLGAMGGEGFFPRYRRPLS